MATLELTTLADHLDDDELATVEKALSDAGSAPLDIDETAEGIILDSNLNDAIFTDFIDRLDANDISADIYLPTDFEECFDVSDFRIASAHALLLALENLREDFFVEEEGEGEEEDENEDDEEKEEEEEEEDEIEDYDSLGEDEDGEDEVGLFSDEDGAQEIKEEHLRHIWKMMYKGARTAINKGLCLVVKA
jgi:hypothetical protein